MLRIYLLQVWFNRQTKAWKTQYTTAMLFANSWEINFNEEQVPDAITLLKFRRLLEANHLVEQMFKAINYVLEQGGAMMKGGTIVDPHNNQCTEFYKERRKKPEALRCIKRKRVMNGALE